MGAQVERFANGSADCILRPGRIAPLAAAAHDANLIGGRMSPAVR